MTDTVHRTEPAPAPFGQVFTDHMLTIAWSAGEGWSSAQLRPYGPLPLDPSAQVLHYGQEVFEGLKAFRAPGGGVHLFRPADNAARMRASCARMMMPALPDEVFVEAVSELVRRDHAWVPHRAGESLYLRPFMIATQASLGFYGPATEYLFVVIASPAGAYFRADAPALTVWVSTEFTRAAPGGTGAAKCGGNYAGTLMAQQHAIDRGCDQVVWLDAATRSLVDEMGTSNIFFVYGDVLVTPPLSDTLLAGITRDSVLRLARDLGYDVRERPVQVESWRRDAADGTLTEVFSSGTSSMITPVGRVRSAQGDWSIGDGSIGPVTTRIREHLQGIQFGSAPDPYGWRSPVDTVDPDA